MFYLLILSNIKFMAQTNVVDPQNFKVFERLHNIQLEPLVAELQKKDLEAKLLHSELARLKQGILN